MKKITLILVIFFFLGTTSKSIACSPATIPFERLLNSYNQNKHILIQGYFLPKVEDDDSAKFKVIRSSESFIQIGKEYVVYEYGPFGNMCEIFEMSTSVEPELVGKNNTRLLIAYKDRSQDGKLVTPIFWATGADVSHNKILIPKYDYNSEEIISSEFPLALDEFWKQISERNLTTETQEQDTESPNSSENWFMKLYKSLTE